MREPTVCAGKLRVWLPLAMVKLSVSDAVPWSLVARIVMACVGFVAVVGVPEMTLLERLRPPGSVPRCE